MKKTKNNKKNFESLDLTKVYEPIDAIKILKENSFTKFEETLEVVFKLGIDTNKTDQNVRGVLNLPNGTGKKIRVAVIAKGDKAAICIDNFFPNSINSFFGFVVFKLTKTPIFPIFFLIAVCI